MAGYRARCEPRVMKHLVQGRSEFCKPCRSVSQSQRKSIDYPATSRLLGSADKIDLTSSRASRDTLQSAGQIYLTTLIFLHGASEISQR